MSIASTLTPLMDKVRKLTGLTEKISIDRLTGLMDYLKWNQTNLLKGTSDQYRDIDINGLYASSATNTDMISTSFSNKQLTYAVTAINTTGTSVIAEIVQYDKDVNWLESTHSSAESLQAGEECSFTVTSTIKPETARLSFHLYIQKAAGKTVKIKNERLYFGTAPGIWTPNPADKVGGVTKLPLFAFLRGGACYAA